MRNKKIIIIGIIIIILGAFLFGIYKISASYLFHQDGTIADGHADLINHLRNLEDPEERAKQIDFALESNIITKEEANLLY